jgi:hypothetical protein
MRPSSGARIGQKSERLWELPSDRATTEFLIMAKDRAALQNNHPAAGKAGIARPLAIEDHWPGLPEPGRSLESS